MRGKFRSAETLQVNVYYLLSNLNLDIIMFNYVDW
jgi:hypothetical protein